MREYLKLLRQHKLMDRISFKELEKKLMISQYRLRKIINKKIDEPLTDSEEKRIKKYLISIGYFP